MRYIGIRVRCIRCKRVSQARRYVDVVGKYGHGFLCWFVYQHIGLRQTMGQVQDQLVSVFGYWVRPQSLGKLKTRAAQIYSTTFKKIVRRVTKGHVVYVDETSVSVGGKRGYPTRRSEGRFAAHGAWWGITAIPALVFMAG